MRRALTILCLAVVLGGCSGQQATPPAPVPATTPNGEATPATTSTASSPSAASPEPATPNPGPASSTQTDPEKLDGALLRADQLDGWTRAEFSDEPVEAKADPQGCSAIYQQSLGKVASDMGATVAYTKEPLFLQEIIDLVNSGSQSVEEIQQAVSQCREFSVDENGEVTKFTATPIQMPALGDRAFGLRLGVTGSESAELLYVWVGHKDTLMMLHIDGDKVDEKLLIDTATRATETLRAAI